MIYSLAIAPYAVIGLGTGLIAIQRQGEAMILGSEIDRLAMMLDVFFHIRVSPHYLQSGIDGLARVFVGFLFTFFWPFVLIARILYIAAEMMKR